MSNIFWLNHPSILIHKDNITEIWPSNKLSYEGKLNAISRLVIILSILGFVFTRRQTWLISGVVSLTVIAILYKFQKNNQVKKKITKKQLKEGFANNENYEKHSGKFTKPTKNNPLMNVMLPEIKYNPKRKAAAPSFNRNVEKKINEKAGNVGPDPRLFLDLGDSISFEQSMRNFHSMPNTKVCNDQTAFAEFCYGDMPSCKEGNDFQCMKNNYRYTMY